MENNWALSICTICRIYDYSFLCKRGKYKHLILTVLKLQSFSLIIIPFIPAVVNPFNQCYLHLSNFLLIYQVAAVAAVEYCVQINGSFDIQSQMSGLETALCETLFYNLF